MIFSDVDQQLRRHAGEPKHHAEPSLPYLARIGTSIIIFVLFVVAHVAATRFLLHNFPFTYSWTELLVDYQGGFAKRGLLGEIAFRSQGVISPARLVSYLLFAAYVSATGVVLFVLRISDEFAGLLFLASPAGWLFPLLNPGAYGRKDAFIILAYVLALSIVGSRVSRSTALIATMAIFVAAGLLVETSWFYYPLVFAALLARRRHEPLGWKLAACAAAAAYTLGCLTLTLRAPHVDTSAIASSWPGGPFADGTSGALCCLNFSLGDAVEIARNALPTLRSYAVAAAFGSIPSALLLARRGSFPLDRLSCAAAAVGIVCALFPICVAIDWGRYIYLWLAALFLWAWTCLPRADSPAEPAARVTAYGVLLRVALLVTYSTTWQLVHVQDPDKSAFIPGILFRKLGATGGLSDPN